MWVVVFCTSCLKNGPKLTFYLSNGSDLRLAPNSTYWPQQQPQQQKHVGGKENEKSESTITNSNTYPFLKILIYLYRHCVSNHWPKWSSVSDAPIESKRWKKSVACNVGEGWNGSGCVVCDVDWIRDPEWVGIEWVPVRSDTKNLRSMGSNGKRSISFVWFLIRCREGHIRNPHMSVHYNHKSNLLGILLGHIYISREREILFLDRHRSIRFP